MAAQWMVTQGDNQFGVAGLQALIDMAQRGDLAAGDMIQPPDANDWVYATEVPALAPHFQGMADDDDDDLDYKPGGGLAKLLPVVMVGALLAVIGIGGIGIIVLVQMLPDGDEVLIGEGGLNYSQMIVTDPGLSLISEPKEGSSAVTAIPKDAVLELLAKRGDFYKARTESGEEGWIPVPAVLPMYQLGGEKVQEKFDPLYNPDHYVDVANASWMQLPDQDASAKSDPEKVTVFHFMFRNKSTYDMTDLVVLTTIKDARGGVIEQLDIPVNGVIPAGGSTMVGMIKPPADDPDAAPLLLTEHTYTKQYANDPDAQERWSAGVEVRMEVEKIDNAVVDIVELRAIPE